MPKTDSEDAQLRTVALQNAESIVRVRRRAEEALRTHSEWLRVTLSSIGDAVISTDAQGRVSFMNEVAESLTGWSLAEAVGHPLPDVFHIVTENGHEPVENPALRALREGTVVGLANHTVLIARDGTERPIDDSAAPIRAEDGEILGCVLVFRDVTERRHADTALRQVEVALRDRESQLRLVTDHAPVMILHCDVEARLKFVNEPYAARFGLTPSQVIGQRLVDIVGVAAYETLEPYLNQALAGEAVEFDAEVPYEAGPQFIHAAYVPERAVNGRVVGLIATLVNVTDRRRVEADLGRLAAIVESSDDAIVSKSLEGVITSWNASAERMFGYTAAEAIGRHISFIIPKDRLSEEDEVLARLRRGEKIDHFETFRQTKDGRLIGISLTVSPIRDASGRVIGASKVARDISERQRAETDRDALLASERFARAEAERASSVKDEFLAMLSHELRTPLNAIVGWIQILRNRPPTEDTLTHGLSVIDRNARMQAQLISDLLDMSRIISGKMRMEVQRVELAVIIETALESIRPAAHAKNLLIDTAIAPMIDAVTGDPIRLQQVAWNMLSNAVKFTPRGGRVHVNVAQVDGEVHISVTDTGKGIKPEFLPHVFERFRQADGSAAREHGGLGLGLAIVKQLVDLHGGSVEVTSDGENKGATFTVRLPLTGVLPTPAEADRRSPAAAAPLRTVPANPPDLAGVTVLVVDDDVDAQDLIRRVLDECGARVVLATSASQALLTIERDPPDVILSDIGMPERDGYSFMTAVRRGGNRTPAAALTAFARSEDRTRALNAGYQTHLSKPVAPDELLATVAALAHKTVTSRGPDHA